MPVSFFPDSKKLEFRCGEDDALELHMDGQAIPLASPRRALPLSDPNRFIVLSDKDGGELGILCSLDALEPNSKSVLEGVLAKVYRIRHIVRILEINKEPSTGQTRWRVELEREGGDTEDTDRDQTGNHPRQGNGNGSSPANMSESLLNKLNLNQIGINGNGKSSSGPIGEETELCIKGPEDVQTARYPYIFLVDTDGNRYDVPDCDALDLESRRCVEGFL